MSDDGTSLRASGSLQDWKDKARFAGTVRLDVPDLGRLTGLAAVQALPASFDAVTAISADAVEISDLALQLDDSVAFGAIESSAGELAVRMNSSRLDFDHPRGAGPGDEQRPSGVCLAAGTPCFHGYRG